MCVEAYVVHVDMVSQNEVAFSFRVQYGKVGRLLNSPLGRWCSPKESAEQERIRQITRHDEAV